MTIRNTQRNPAQPNLHSVRWNELLERGRWDGAAGTGLRPQADFARSKANPLSRIGSPFDGAAGVSPSIS